VLHRFKYRFHKELSSSVKRWVCSISGNKKCLAYSYLKTEGKINIVEIIDNHNHSPHEEQLLDRNELMWMGLLAAVPIFFFKCLLFTDFGMTITHL
jgi:hypothetical protein